jgi:hypothetical protein
MLYFINKILLRKIDIVRLRFEIIAYALPIHKQTDR